MKITIAALLHDIGKFYQRAEKELGNKPLYEQYIKNNGYIHGAFTAKFFDENINSNLPDYNVVLHESAGHHKADHSIIKTSDFIASGHDRKDGKEDILNNQDIDFESGNYVSKRMNIIFNEVNILDKELYKNDRYELKLNKYSNIESNKQTSTLNKEDARKEYKYLYDQFKSEIDKMNKKGYSDYKELHQLIYPIIKEYTISIPGSTYNLDVPTVSLFDHLKLTTAIANCLKKKDITDFCFIDYDLSGIQKFIYKIAEGRESKENIAKFLRTRSFYLNVLSDFIAYYITNEFDLTYENVLYSSGGRGRVLVPNIDGFKNKLKEISSNIEKELFKLHKGEISFSIVYSKVSSNDLCYMRIDDIINDNLDIISDKNKKFISVIQSEEFSPINDSSDSLCKMCNNNETNNKYCSFCDTLLEVNNLLVNNEKFIIEYVYEKNEIGKQLNLKIGNLGTIIFHKVSDFKLNRKNSYYMSINCYEIGETKKYAKSNIGGKSFEEIAKNNEGDEKLAVIKMDVDNLGYIFMNGISKDKETISKNLTLSRMVDFFFTKKLVEICNREKYKKSIYINYAGGDDLVIILPASMSLDLVYDINNEFNIFTGFNKSFHISAGIEIFHPTSPVRYAIDRAENYLESSKGVKGKESFTILDVTLNNKKLSELLKEIDVYSEGLNNNSISRSGLYEIYNYIIRSLSNKNSEIAFMKYIPLIAYAIKRNMNSYWFEKLKSIFVSKDINVEILKYYKVVFAMALMKTRKRD